MSGIDMELGDEKEEHGTGGRWFSGGSWNECEGRGDVCESNDERRCGEVRGTTLNLVRPVRSVQTYTTWFLM